MMTRDYESDYNKDINKYKVKVGMTLKEWEERNWITKEDPYGWIQWYCNFYNERRIPEIDRQQIDRWQRIAGKEKGRWRKTLVNKIKKNCAKYNDFQISPKIRQTLLHWGYEIVEKDI